MIFILKSFQISLAFVLLLSGSASAIDDCALYRKIMNNLGVSMSRYRLLISSSEDPETVAAATAELERHSAEYLKTKRQFSQKRCDGWSRD